VAVVVKGVRREVRQVAELAAEKEMAMAKAAEEEENLEVEMAKGGLGEAVRAVDSEEEREVAARAAVVTAVVTAEVDSAVGGLVAAGSEAGVVAPTAAPGM
jgi:hypothetical protein